MKPKELYVNEKDEIKIRILDKVKRGLWRVKHIHPRGVVHELTTGHINKYYKLRRFE